MNVCQSTIYNHFRLKRAVFIGALAAFFAVVGSVFADATNSPALTPLPPVVPEFGASMLRVLGALALVLALFLGGVWFFRNWQRLMVKQGKAPKLNIFETRSLGGRQSIYVVGYEQERFLLASSPGGVTFLTHLPQADEKDVVKPEATANPSFTQALQQVLKGK